MKENINIVLLDKSTLGEVKTLDQFSQWGEYKSYDFTKQEEVVERITNADVVITNKVLLTGADLKQAKQLKLVCVAATGVNNVDLETANSLGIAVKNVKGYSTYGVAQQTFATILSLVHHLPFLDRYVKEGLYSNGGMFTYIDESIVELKDKTIGIIGLGDIGKQVARIAIAFGCKVIYYSTSGKNDDKEYNRVSFEELLSTSDVLTIHAPLNEATQGLIDYKALCQMKNTALIHNAGRGGIIVEDDLCRALLEHKIAAAGLDVYAQEPLSIDSPLLDKRLQDRLLLTPHSAWSAKESRERLVEGVIKNIQLYFSK